MVRYDVLTTKDATVRITQIDERTLLIEAREGGFFSHPVERLFLTRTQFRAGEEFQGAGFVARVERVDAATILAIRFIFPTPLTDPRRTLIVFDGTHYRRFGRHPQ